MDKNKSVRLRIPLKQKIILVLFGIALCLVLLEIGLRLGGFIILSIQERRNMVSLRQKGTYRILCLGESTTQNTYPPFLEEILNQHNRRIKFSVIDKGVSGHNTGFILAQLEANLDKYQPDLVVTMMGINDSGYYMPYEADSNNKILLFFKSFRTYKLTRLLWLHIITKAKETGILKLQKNNWFAQRQEAGSREAYTGRDKLTQAETHLKKAIELEPRNDKPYFELGWVYLRQDKVSEAEASFKKTIELNPKHDNAYVGLGLVYLHQNKLSEAEALFKKALELNPQNAKAYSELGLTYLHHLKFSEAEASFKKVIELTPQDDRAYVRLGAAYLLQGKSSDAEALLKRTLEVNPKNDMAYIQLEWFYRLRGKFSEAEALLKKAIEVNPKSERAYVELGWFYLSQGKLSEAEALFKKDLKLNPQSDRAYRALRALCTETDDPGLAREYDKKANELRLSYYSPVTTRNYKDLKAILDKRGIVYVCVQYPMRNIEPLKRIFQGNSEGIIFIDNERIFKDAISKASYNEYFIDLFGGDFGHCTDKGNRLLAENIAKAILKEIYEQGM